jgi:hypothetical protein
VSVILPPLLWKPTQNKSSRHGAKVSLVTVHGTAGSYAGAVAWLCNPKADASAHVVLREDGGEATQLVAWDEKAWACVAYNGISDNIELAWSKGQTWGKPQLRVAARIVAFRLHKRGLPARWMRAGSKGGFTRHRDLGALGGNHTECPTIPLPLWLWFVARVKYELRRGHFRPEWGR